jgi:hypothetical protein
VAETDARFDEHRDESLRLLGIALDDDASASDGARRNLSAAAHARAAVAQAVACFWQRG